MKLSENYVIGMDFSNGEDESVLTIARREGERFVITKTYFGKDAEYMYERLRPILDKYINANEIVKK